MIHLKSATLPVRGYPCHRQAQGLSSIHVHLVEPRTSVAAPSWGRHKPEGGGGWLSSMGCCEHITGTHGVQCAKLRHCYLESTMVYRRFSAVQGHSRDLQQTTLLSPIHMKAIWNDDDDNINSNRTPMTRQNYATTRLNWQPSEAPLRVGF